jgi:hypothetical protein
MATKIATFVACARGVRDVSYQEKSINKYRDITDKVQWSSSKVPQFIDQSQLNLHVLERMRGECVV